MLNKVKWMLWVLVSLLLQACSSSNSYYSVSGRDTERSYVNTQADPVVAANITLDSALNR